jgi:hypothetical protein
MPKKKVTETESVQMSCSARNSTTCLQLALCNVYLLRRENPDINSTISRGSKPTSNQKAETRIIMFIMVRTALSHKLQMYHAGRVLGEVLKRKLLLNYICTWFPRVIWHIFKLLQPLKSHIRITQAIHVQQAPCDGGAVYGGNESSSPYLPT